MGDFFKRGLMVVFVCLIIYFIFFFVSVCLKVNFPKLNPSQCPENYEISNCEKDDDTDVSCCKLKDTSNLGLDPSFNKYFENLRTDCDKEEIKYGDGDYKIYWDPNKKINSSIKTTLCKWSKSNTSSESGNNKLNSCFVPWDSITNGLDNERKPIC